MKTEVVREHGPVPALPMTRTEQECTRVTGADGSVAVEFRVCATCGAVSLTSRAASAGVTSPG